MQISDRFNVMAGINVETLEHKTTSPVPQKEEKISERTRQNARRCVLSGNGLGSGHQRNLSAWESDSDDMMSGRQSFKRKSDGITCLLTREMGGSIAILRILRILFKSRTHAIDGLSNRAESVDAARL